MQAVAADKYDKAYFETTFAKKDFATPLALEDFGHIYRTMVELLPLRADETVVDVGCGNGELAILLNKVFGCTVIGLDYSADAIDICNANLARWRTHHDDKGKVSFRHYDQLPSLTGVSAVHFCDVLEHMTDAEIASTLDVVRTWNDGQPIRIGVHTDNNDYLRFIRPGFDALALLTRRQTRATLRARNEFERERHINLTTPRRLRREMRAQGFRETRLLYPTPTEEKIRAHLGPGQPRAVVAAVKAGLRMAKRLSPSFYAVYESSR